VAIGPAGRGGSTFAGRAGGVGAAPAITPPASGNGTKLFAMAMTVLSKLLASALS